MSTLIGAIREVILPIINAVLAIRPTTLAVSFALSLILTMVPTRAQDDMSDFAFHGKPKLDYVPPGSVYDDSPTPQQRLRTTNRVDEERGRSAGRIYDPMVVMSNPRVEEDI